MEYFKILVVHRHAAMQEEVASIMAMFKPCVRLFSCGIDGLQAAKLELFNLILCGTDLPLITGFEMIRAIRNLSRNCFTPVIFISDKVNENEATLSRQLKCLAIVGRANLGSALHYTIENARALQSIHEIGF